MAKLEQTQMYGVNASHLSSDRWSFLPRWVGPTRSAPADKHLHQHWHPQNAAQPAERAPHGAAKRRYMQARAGDPCESGRR